jgi:GNAT superfamily N-acetyltransferase
MERGAVNFTGEQTFLLSDPQSPESVFVAEEDAGEIIGFAGGGPEDAARFPGELYAIYLLQSAQGHGVGRRLARAVAEWLAQQGMHAMIVWVLAENSSRHFYKKMRKAPVFQAGDGSIVAAATRTRCLTSDVVME